MLYIPRIKIFAAPLLGPLRFILLTLSLCWAVIYNYYRSQNELPVSDSNADEIILTESKMSVANEKFCKSFKFLTSFLFYLIYLIFFTLKLVRLKYHEKASLTHMGLLQLTRNQLGTYTM